MPQSTVAKSGGTKAQRRRRSPAPAVNQPVTASLRLIIAVACGALVLVLGLVQASLVIPLNDEIMERAVRVVNTSSTAAVAEVGAVISELAVLAAAVTEAARLTHGGNLSSVAPTSIYDTTWDFAWQDAFSASLHREHGFRFGYVSADAKCITFEGLDDSLASRVVTNADSNATFTFVAANRTDTAKSRLHSVVRRTSGNFLDCAAFTTTVQGAAALPRSQVLPVAFVARPCLVQNVLVAAWLVPVWSGPAATAVSAAASTAAEHPVGFVVAIVPLATLSAVMRVQEESEALRGQRAIIAEVSTGALIAADVPHPVAYNPSLVPAAAAATGDVKAAALPPTQAAELRSVVGSDGTARTCVPAGPATCRVHVVQLGGALSDFAALFAASPDSFAAAGHGARLVQVGGREVVVASWPVSLRTAAAQWVIVTAAPLDQVAAGYSAAVRDSVTTTAVVAVLCTLVVTAIVFMSTAPLRAITVEMHSTTARFRATTPADRRAAASRFVEVGAIQDLVWEISDVLAQLRGFLPAGVIREADSATASDARSGGGLAASSSGAAAGGGIARQATLATASNAQQPSRHSELEAAAIAPVAVDAPVPHQHVGNVGNEAGEGAAAAGAANPNNARAAFLLLHLGAGQMQEGEAVEEYRAFHDAVARVISARGGVVEHMDATSTWVSFNCQTPCATPEDVACHCAVEIAQLINPRTESGFACDAVICVDTFVPTIVELAVGRMRAKLIEAKRAAIICLLPPLARLHGVRIVVTGDVSSATSLQTIVLDNLNCGGGAGGAVRLYELQAVQKQSTIAPDTLQARTRRAFAQMLNGDYNAASACWEEAEGPHARAMLRLCRALAKRQYAEPYARSQISPWALDAHFAAAPAAGSPLVAPTAEVAQLPVAALPPPLQTLQPLHQQYVP